MDKEKKDTFFYARLFLLMIIPVYGFCFTALLAFSKEITDELKYLARGAFIARIVLLIVVGIVAAIFFTIALPYIMDFVARLQTFGIFLQGV